MFQRIVAIEVNVQVLQALSGSNQVSVKCLKLTIRFRSASFLLDRID